jgi:hypothetical protein
MKKVIFLLAFLFVAGSIFAQGNYGWPEYGNRDEISVENDGQNKSITIDKNYYRWRSLDREVGLNLYGSRYRKASSNKGWGMTLSCLVAPALLVGSLAAVDSEVPGVAVVGGLALAGTLYGGITLWRKGQRELDAMLDDYAAKYAPRPRTASLSVGPTRNGMGLALNF